MFSIKIKLVFKKGFWDELQYFDFFEGLPRRLPPTIRHRGQANATGYPAVCRAGAQIGLVFEKSSKRRTGSHTDLEIFVICSHYQCSLFSERIFPPSMTNRITSSI